MSTLTKQEPGVSYDPLRGRWAALTVTPSRKVTTYHDTKAEAEEARERRLFVPFGDFGDA